MSALFGKFFKKRREKSRAVMQLSRLDTLRYVVEKGCSVARFGDGEMHFALHGLRRGFEGIHFQRPDPLLALQLRKILDESIEGLLVCYNNHFMQEDYHRVVLDYERNPRKEYSEYLSLRRERDTGVLERKRQRRVYRRQFETVQKSTTWGLFGDSTLFAIGFFVEEYCADRMLEVCDLYRKLIERRKILIVAPERPVLGDSFRRLHKQGLIRSAERVDFISIPEADCFQNYEDILKRIKSFQNIDTVFIQAGPTATVMAAGLAGCHGITAYDVGTWNVSLQKAAKVHGINF